MTDGSLVGDTNRQAELYRIPRELVLHLLEAVEADPAIEGNDHVIINISP
jgi:hypothetical protein